MSDHLSKAARLALLALTMRRGYQGEVRKLARTMGASTRTISRDMTELSKVVEKLSEMIKLYGLSPELDQSVYTAKDVAQELGVTHGAVLALAKRRGLTSKISPSRGHRWNFTRADVEAMRQRSPRGRKRG